ncbi:FAD-dependent oxidoreductase [Vibrio parahaemolyticus]|uniref:FAD-dependent oxidoreductase n=1 Tax=Vibrio parahaemolyticus TaxID=670 RepID=UPI003AAF5339
MTAQYHTIILGGGNAGFGVSSVLKEAGKSMAIVEQAEFGGTCPNRGCTPKKILVEAAGCLDMIRRAEAHGIEVSAPVIHWEKLIARKDEMIGFIPDAMHKLADNRATVYRGQARFTGPVLPGQRHE